MATVDDALAPKRHWLAQNETRYLRAKEYVKSDQATADKLKALEKIRVITGKNEAETWRMGRIAQIFDDLTELDLFIVEYEHTQKFVTETAARNR